MLDDQQLIQVLSSKNLIDGPTTERARALSAESGQSLYQIVIEQQLVDEEKAIIAISKAMNLHCVSLKEFEPNRKLLELLPEGTAAELLVMPLGLTEEEGEKRLYAAMSDPLNDAIIEQVSDITGFPVVPLLAGPLDVRSAIERAYADSDQPIVEVEVQDNMGLDDMLEDILPDDFDGYLDETEIEVTDEDPAGAPPQESAPAAGGGQKPFNFAINFGDLDLSVSGDKAPASARPEDKHNRQTLPAGTKLPKVSPAASAPAPAAAEPATPPGPVQNVQPAAPEPPAAPAPASDGAPSLFDDWELDELTDDEPAPAESKSDMRRPPSDSSRSEKSNVRYVADPNLKRRSGDEGFPANVPVSDLVWATVRVLMKKGYLTEEEIMTEVRAKRNRAHQRMRRGR